MDGLIASKISMGFMLRNAHRAMKLFEEIALTLWDLNGTLSTFAVLIARSHSLEDRSMSMEESHIARLTIINRLDLSVLDAERPSLDDVLTLSTRNGILSISFALSA